jgi:hypothetical protein
MHISSFEPFAYKPKPLCESAFDVCWSGLVPEFSSVICLETFLFLFFNILNIIIMRFYIYVEYALGLGIYLRVFDKFYKYLENIVELFK